MDGHQHNQGTKSEKSRITTTKSKDMTTKSNRETAKRTEIKQILSSDQKFYFYWHHAPIAPSTSKEQNILWFHWKVFFNLLQHFGNKLANLLLDFLNMYVPW